jgi:hypothetical protein
MPKRSPEATTDWVANKLSSHSQVKSVERLGQQTLKVRRKEFEAVVVGIISESRVDKDTIESLVDADPEVEFIANVPERIFLDRWSNKFC